VFREFCSERMLGMDLEHDKLELRTADGAKAARLALGVRRRVLHGRWCCGVYGALGQTTSEVVAYDDGGDGGPSLVSWRETSSTLIGGLRGSKDGLLPSVVSTFRESDGWTAVEIILSWLRRSGGGVPPLHSEGLRVRFSEEMQARGYTPLGEPEAEEDERHDGT